MADLKKVFAPKPKEVMPFSIILGTLIIRFDLPMTLVNDINKVYDDNREKLNPWNDYLAGKIKEENKINDILTDSMKDAFLSCFKSYLDTVKKSYYHCSPDAAWINEMKAGEYNPLHMHKSPISDLGLSSVLMLKRPSTYGKETSNEKENSNGCLEFAGGDQNPLSISNVRLDIQVGQFYVFPYSLLHSVYPFSGTDEVRRTMSYNCDLLKPAQLTKMSK